MYTYLLVAGRLARLVHRADNLNDGQQHEGSNDAAHRVQSHLGQLEEGWQHVLFFRLVNNRGCDDGIRKYIRNRRTLTL